MTTETVKYIIGAEDKATPVWNKFQKQVVSTDQSLARTANSAKGSSEAFGVMASQLSRVVPEFDILSSSIGQTSSYLGKLKEAAQQGGTALALMKTAGVAVLAVGVYEGVTALAKWIGGWDALQKKLQEARAELSKTHKMMLEVVGDDFQKRLEKAQGSQSSLGFLAFDVEKQAENVAARVKAERDILSAAEQQTTWIQKQHWHYKDFMASHEESLALLEDEAEVYRRQLKTIKDAKEALTEQHQQQAQQANDERMKKAAEDRLAVEKAIASVITNTRRTMLEQSLKGTEAAAANLTRLKEQMIALKDGNAAARAFNLEQQGIEGGTASQIARLEEEVRKAQGMASQSVKVNNAAESRLLTGRVEQDVAKQTANATIASQKALERATKQLDQLLAKQDQLIKNTESQLEILR